MPFTVAQRESLLKFLERIDKEVELHIPPYDAAEFFSILVDYSVDDEEFEIKIATLLFKIPEKMEGLKPSIKKISLVRKAMLEKVVNAQESREITLDYFFNRIDEYLEYNDFLIVQSEDEFEANLREERKERRAKKLEMEKQLRQLKEDRQNIFEQEKNDRIERHEQKKEEEVWLQKLRQQEYEDELEVRKKRKEQVEIEIKQLSKKLQSQYEQDRDDRKLKRQQKEQFMEIKQKKLEEEQLKQAELRKRIKDENHVTLKQRTRSLQEEQERQRLKRTGKKKLDEEIREKQAQENKKMEAD